jgi:predicted secreted protein
VSLRQVEALFDDASLSTELKSLDTSLYSGSQGTWDGAALAETVRRLRRVQRQSDRGKGVKLELYPA